MLDNNNARKVTLSKFMSKPVFRQAVAEIALGVPFNADGISYRDCYAYEFGRLFAIATGEQAVLFERKGKKLQVSVRQQLLYTRLLQDGTIPRVKARGRAKPQVQAPVRKSGPSPEELGL